MIPMHVCPGCGQTITSAWFACRGCWPRLPVELRTALLRAWGRRQHGTPGAATEHETAKGLATAWLTENPR